MLRQGDALVADLQAGPWGARLDAVAAVLPGPCALVGGFVRDALLGRSPEDLDLVCEGDPGPALQALARSWPKVTAVPLDLQRGYWRLAFADRSHLDVAQAEGATLLDDLRRRDFTLNALALAWPSGALLDPTGGRQDLACRRLVLPRPDALQADPLRVLRAHRLAACLGLSIPPATEAALGEAQGALRQVARERIGAELAKWAKLPALPGVEAWVEAGLWEAWGGDAAQAEARRAWPLALRAWAQAPGPWAGRLWGPELGGGLSPWATLALSSQAEGPVALGELATALRWPKAVARWAHQAWAGASYLEALGPQPGPRGLHRWWGLAGAAWPGALTLVACGLPLGWPLLAPCPEGEAPWSGGGGAGPLAQAQAWALAREGAPWPKLADGQAVMAWAGLAAGPRVAQAMADLAEAQAAGELCQAGEVAAWARAWGEAHG